MKHATLSIHRGQHDPHLTITQPEDCHDCNGNGYTIYAVPGGQWTTWQGGMWIPDEREIACETCAGTGRLTRSRCAVCEGLHADVDAYGVAHHETACDCDPEAVHAAIAAFDNAAAVTASMAELYASANAQGMTVQSGVHHVPAAAFRALAALHGVSVGGVDANGMRYRIARVSANTSYGPQAVTLFEVGQAIAAQAPAPVQAAA